MRQIYDMYLFGASKRVIAKKLNQQGVFNRHCELWMHSSILYILSNERYTGDSIWQKTYQTETLPREQKKNRGEVPKYYAKSTHPPIVSHEEYMAVQNLRTQKTGFQVIEQSSHIFNKKLLCGNCGASFRPKTDKNKRYRVCRSHAENADLCSVSQIPEVEIEEAFLRLCCKLKHAPGILQRVLGNLYEMTNHRMLWSPDVIELNKRISDILSQNQMLAVLKQQGLVDPDIFISKTNELTEQLRKLKLEKERLLEAKTDDTLSQTKQIMEVIRDVPDCLEEFDAELFGELIDKIIVEDNTHLRFRLKNGLELREAIRRAVR